MERSAQLNRDCHCISVDRDRLLRELGEHGLGAPAAVQKLSPMFADFPVFLAREEITTIVKTVAAVQSVAALPTFQAEALLLAPPIARVDHGQRGTMYGYDFHLTPAGPRLIEVNTNAGGALLSVALARTQVPCCGEVTAALQPQGVGLPDVPEALVDSFVREYRRQRGADAVLRTVAIVDEAPETQFLFPEFVLFQTLFRSHGIDALVVNVNDLRHERGGLWHGSTRIELVYNRLTDFYFTSSSSQALATAYQVGDVVVTPNPRAHALYANKRHLVTFADAAELKRLGANAESIETLTRVVPRAELLIDDNRARLWADRKRYFFKPLCGYGSKAAYRGDKLTHKTWDALSGHEYVAQELATPSERVVRVDGTLTPLKLDVRAYVDDEQILLLASRLYQGQTTNFRTPGGGFASVFSTTLR